MRDGFSTVVFQTTHVNVFLKEQVLLKNCSVDGGLCAKLLLNPFSL